jgi:hypothetical protein
MGVLLHHSVWLLSKHEVRGRLAEEGGGRGFGWVRVFAVLYILCARSIGGCAVRRQHRQLVGDRVATCHTQKAAEGLMSHSWQYSTDPSSWVAIAIASELGVAWAATFCRVCVMVIQHFAKAEDISRRRVDIFRLLLHAYACLL